MELRTQDLILRPPRVQEAAQALQLLSDPDVALWNPAPAVTDHGTAVAWCQRGADWSSGHHATFSIVGSSEDRLLGNVSLFAIDTEQATAQIGYRVVPAARGRGVATAALRAVSEWAFADRLLLRIELHHAVDNVAACRVAVKAGYALEGTSDWPRSTGTVNGATTTSTPASPQTEPTAVGRRGPATTSGRPPAWSARLPGRRLQGAEAEPSPRGCGAGRHPASG